MRLDEIAKKGLGRVGHIHFVGIGGSGMCGLAEILCRLGYRVSGSDIQSSASLERLRKLKATIYTTHLAKQVNGADLLVRSAAISDRNPEIVAANKKGIPVIKRAEMLAEVMRFGHGIAVAGAHGKTTTTSMLASVLTANGEDITFVVGGLVKSSGSNACLGSGKYVIAEADESDASFLCLNPVMAIVTNLDEEHLSGYGGKFENIKSVFLQFLRNLPFYGLAVLCYEDESLRSMQKKLPCPSVTYGFDKNADYIADNIRQLGMRTDFRVMFPDGEKAEVYIKVPGSHNVLNALACLALADQLKLSRRKSCKGLQQFDGVARRQDVLGNFSGKEVKDVCLADDYGHHPREIEATLNALKAGACGKRYVMVFQPHRYTRTRDLYDEFVRVLSQTDILLLLPVYTAGEKFIAGADTRSLAGSIRQFGKVDPIYVEDRAELPGLLRRLLRSEDMVITQGAGDIAGIARELAKENLYL